MTPMCCSKLLDESQNTSIFSPRHMSLLLVEPSPEKHWLLCVLLSNLKMHRSIHPLGLCAASALLFLLRYTWWEVSRVVTSLAHGILSWSGSSQGVCLFSRDILLVLPKKTLLLSTGQRGNLMYPHLE